MALRFLTAGESHGPGLTVIVEGLPAGVPVIPGRINRELIRRMGGYGRGGRMKIEKDRVEGDFFHRRYRPAPPLLRAVLHPHPHPASVLRRRDRQPHRRLDHPSRPQPLPPTHGPARSFTGACSRSRQPIHERLRRDLPHRRLQDPQDRSTRRSRDASGRRWVAFESSSLTRPSGASIESSPRVCTGCSGTSPRQWSACPQSPRSPQ